MKAIYIIIGLALSTLSSLADPVSWTPEERARQRQAVVSAKVKSVEKVRDQQTKGVHLMRAVLQVTKVDKGKDLIAGAKNIAIYYESSPLGAGYRCPTFPVLKVGETGKFYLRYDSGLTKKKTFVLGMGSDMHRQKTK